MSLTRYNPCGEHALATNLNLTVRERHSLAIAGITGAGGSPLLRAMRGFWARELGASVRQQKLWLARGSVPAQSACPRRSSERHDRAMLRGTRGPAGLADLTERLDGIEAAPKCQPRRRVRGPQRPEFCPIILPPALFAPLLGQRQSDACESRERAEAAPITAQVLSNGGPAP